MCVTLSFRNIIYALFRINNYTVYMYKRYFIGCHENLSLNYNQVVRILIEIVIYDMCVYLE